MMPIRLCALILFIVVLSANAIALESQYNVNLANSTELGTYMTNATFFTLYRYLGDPPGKKVSTCNGNCSEIWSPFYVENLVPNPELKSRDFDVINRNDGTKQLTYKGWPLYLYTGDTKPYQTRGQAKNGVWFVVNPQNLTR